MFKKNPKCILLQKSLKKFPNDFFNFQSSAVGIPGESVGKITKGILERNSSEKIRKQNPVNASNNSRIN